MTTPIYWKRACQELSKRDRVLKKLISDFPDATLRKRGSAFQTLMRSIVGQQISVSAAETVWRRVTESLSAINPQAVLSVPASTLRKAGLSARKVEYVQDLAKHFDQGVINPRRFKTISDEVLIEELTDVRGIGRWTAEMFLIFNLQRPDIYPLQDIGLLRAVERHYFKGQKTALAEIAKIGEGWRPWRSVATWYLWRSLDPIVVEY